MNDLVSLLASLFGVEDATLLALLPLVILVSQLVARLIPNDATGVAALVRKLASVVGLYASSRVTKGVSVTDVAAASLPASNAKRPPRNFFNDDRGSVSIRHALMLPVVGSMLLLLSACMTPSMERVRDGARHLCENTDLLIEYLNRIESTEGRDALLSAVETFHMACPYVLAEAQRRRATQLAYSI